MCIRDRPPTEQCSQTAPVPDSFTRAPVPHGSARALAAACRDPVLLARPPPRPQTSLELLCGRLKALPSLSGRQVLLLGPPVPAPPSPGPTPTAALDATPPSRAFPPCCLCFFPGSAVLSPGLLELAVEPRPPREVEVQVRG